MSTGTRRKKEISEREREFARVIAEAGLGPTEAARKVFGWRCEDPKEQMKAKDLARHPRVKNEINRIKEQLKKEAEAEQFLSTAGQVDMDQMQDYIIKQLFHIRNNPNAKSQTRFNALKLLQKMYDPASDQSLIYRWIDYAWKYQKAHCPCCHKSFPLWKVNNPSLSKWRTQHEVEAEEGPFDISDIDRRLKLIKKADPRNRPHPSQTPALSAKERHIVGKGPARAGKSYLLALFALLTFLLPGVEIWILSRVYEDARSEVDYIRRFIRTLFHPYENILVKEYYSAKTNELSMISKWGSELKVRSAKSKGSITGRALEIALVAEPGWIEGDLYEELRARMSERLGRIIALGTPKGTAGFIGRMVRTYGRDPRTGQYVRRQSHERLIENGCPWNVSMLEYGLRAHDNPAFVKSESGAARQELTDVEYASEFEGLMATIEGAKFGNVIESHLQKIPRAFFEEAEFVLGVDQGQTNFGACLVAYNGRRVIPCWEYFNSKDTESMQRNLTKLRQRVPLWIQKLGGDPTLWKLTITDRDPPLIGDFQDMADRGMKWPTEVVYRHRNNIKYLQNWRRECQEFVNNLASRGNLLWHLSDEYNMDSDESPGTGLLHDQVRNALDVAPNPEAESKSDSKKGWDINDPWRGDHVVDAWYMAMWTILSGQFDVAPKSERLDQKDPWAEHKAAFDYKIAAQERQELTGYRDSREVPTDFELFKKHFKRPMTGGMFTPMHYGDEG
jgi:hypothetical protein